MKSYSLQPSRSPRLEGISWSSTSGMEIFSVSNDLDSPTVHRSMTAMKHLETLRQIARTQRRRAESAEARVRELEETVKDMQADYDDLLQRAKDLYH